MPKVKNQETYDAMLHAAHHLFLQKGYNNTSYQDIATQAGTKKNLVQYHFPQKSLLAVSFFETLLKEIMGYLDEKGIHHDNPYQNMLLIGYAHFAFLLFNQRTRDFTLDILKDRELSASMLLFDFDWGMSFLGLSQDLQPEHLQDDVVYAMGGFYELLFTYLNKGNLLDFGPYLKRVVTVIMERNGFPRDMAEEQLSAVTPKNIDMTELCQVLLQKF